MQELSPKTALEYFKKNRPLLLNNLIDLNDRIEKLQNALVLDNGKPDHAKALKYGKDVCKIILNESIGFLSRELNSPANRSYDFIKYYVDRFIVFEDLLFGLDSTYRDHLMHSLWVYFYGHQCLCETGGYKALKIAGQLHIQYFNLKNEPDFIVKAPDIIMEQNHLEAMWGIISLVHDFGYPIEAITNRPDRVFGKILEHFAIESNYFSHFDMGSRINILHQSLCDKISSMYRPLPFNEFSDKMKMEFDDMLEAMKKEYKDKKFSGIPVLTLPPTVSKSEAIEMEFKIAYVNRNHSAWSAILAFKNLIFLHESDGAGGGDIIYKRLLTSRDILYSIVHHTSERPTDGAFNRFQFILLLMDDIEEANRYSRGGESRGLVSDHCEAKWKISESKMKIELDYSKSERSGKSKYIELLTKYEIQESRNNSNFTIDINIIDENFQNQIRLSLDKD